VFVGSRMEISGGGFGQFLAVDLLASGCLLLF
jgi:hypothetical protein